MKPLDLLIVAPHPDDAEISVGGIIALSRAQGLTVGVLELTSGEPTPHGTPEIRRAETEAATKILDLNYRHNLNLPNRSLEPTLDARRKLAEVFRHTRPAMILAPYWQDAHPDHVSASKLCDDARFWSKLSRSDLAGERFWPPMLMHYFSIHLRIHPAASVVVDVSDHIETKMKAVAAWHSQLIQGRSADHPTVIDDIKDRCRYWGWTIGKAYAEPLHNREQIGISSVSHLLPNC